MPGAAGFGGGNDGSAPPAAAGGGADHLPPRPVFMESPSTETVIGHALSLNGHRGTMLLEQKGEGLALTKLMLAGDKISKPGQSCTVDVALPIPLDLAPAGRPTGTKRFDAAVPACSFTLDVLNGAALVQPRDPVCTFAQADCRVEAGGLWGPPAAEITAKRAQELEHERVKFETTMRANFHALIRKAGSDRAAVKALARAQAAFSSEREMTCRDYQEEATHGLCSTEITQARALALLAQFGPMPKPRERTHTSAKPE